jgi:hypothetical protein
MPHRTPPPPPCAGCGGALGVYEPLRWVRPDGTSVVEGWLRIVEDARHEHPDSRFFHAQCAAVRLAGSSLPTAAS